MKPWVNTPLCGLPGHEVGGCGYVGQAEEEIMESLPVASMRNFEEHFATILILPRIIANPYGGISMAMLILQMVG